MKNFWHFFINNRQFSYIILIALIFFGAQSLLTIPRESAPEVQIPVAIITTIFPGSSAEDVEMLVTNEIESGLIGNLENVDNITSTSKDGISSVVVEFNADASIDESVREVKDEVDKIKSSLPPEADDPFVSEINFVDEPVMFITLQSEMSDLELINLVEDVEAELIKINGVSKIETVGLPEREIQVIVDKKSLERYNLSILEITNALRSSNSSLPIGDIDVSGVSYSVVFNGNLENIEDVKNTALKTTTGQNVYLRDVATIINTTDERDSISRSSIEGELSQKAVSLQVFKRSGGDVTRLSSEIKETLKEMEDTLLEDTPYLISFDTGEFVKDDLKNLSLTALQTIFLVMIVLFLAIGWREAILAGLTIPLSFMVAFIGLKLSGNTINFVSLFSLILSVGILVDSAIVVVESIHTKMKEMEDKVKSAKQTITEFYTPITAGTNTTIAVFAPLFLLSGVTGQFIASIPFTIIFVLIASLFVALAIVPLVASIFLKRRARMKMEVRQEELTIRLQDRYRKFLGSFVNDRRKQNRFIRIMIFGFILSLLLPILGLVKVEFFPQENIDFIFIEVERPQGTTLEITDLSVREVEEYLYENPYIESFTTQVGALSSFNQDGGGGGEKFANLTLLLKKERDKSSSQIVDELREKLASIETATIRVFEPNNGPPTGKPVEIKFVSESLTDLNKSILQGEDVLDGIENTTEITSSLKTDALQFELNIDRAKASQFGITPSIVASTLRTAVHGVEATTINSLTGDIDVVVKMDLGEKVTLDSLKKISIPTPNGNILIGSVVNSNLGNANTLISHENGKRIGRVSSELEEGGNAREVISQFEEKIKDKNIPLGVEIKYGGETEDVNESFKEMGLAVLLGIIIISSILVLQFKSWRQSLFIISIIPLSLIGVLVGLFLSGKALSFPSMMGFIALSGIVVNNSIILIDTMNRIRKDYPHYPIDDVVLKGATSRLRPILLTTLTTVIGIIPLTYASELWAPLAYAIIFGLTFAVVVTLILVPILYSRWPGKME